MGLRRWSIRMRIFLLVAIPILSLIGLYVFTATITASSAISLARSTTVKNTVALPVANVDRGLYAERIAAVIYLAAPVPRSLAALRAEEHKTDQAVAGFKAAATAAGSASAAEQQAFATMSADLAGLPALRSRVVSLSISRPAVITAYESIVNQDSAILTQLILQQDTNVSLATQSLVLSRSVKVEDLLLQEDVLVLGDTVARSFSPADRQEFTQLAGARRILYAQVIAEFDPAYRAIFNKAITPGIAGLLEALETG
jgi:hypothetical protein